MFSSLMVAFRLLAGIWTIQGCLLLVTAQPQVFKGCRAGVSRNVDICSSLIVVTPPNRTQTAHPLSSILEQHKSSILNLAMLSAHATLAIWICRSEIEVQEGSTQ